MVVYRRHNDMFCNGTARRWPCCRDSTIVTPFQHNCLHWDVFLCNQHDLHYYLQCILRFLQQWYPKLHPWRDRCATWRLRPSFEWSYEAYTIQVTLHFQLERHQQDILRISNGESEADAGTSGTVALVVSREHARDWRPLDKQHWPQFPVFCHAESDYWKLQGSAEGLV